MFKKSWALIIFTIFLLLALTVSFLFIRPGKIAKDYNVIIVSIDSLRADHLGSYGYSRSTSINIDEFASNAILFENATTQGGWTIPSYVSLFTSTYPSTHGVSSQKSNISEKQKMLAEILKGYGYETVAFAENPGVDPIIGFDRGFDAYHFRLNENHTYQDLKINWTKFEMTDIKNFLKEMGNEKFFLFIQLESVHSPYLPNAPYDALFDPDYNGSMPTTEDFYKIYYGLCESDKKLCRASLESLFWLLADNQPSSLISEYMGNRGQISYIQHLRDNKIKVYNHDHIIALYDGAIREVDDFFGEFLKELERDNLMNKTIVIFTSDHGEEFYEHGGYIHSGGHVEITHVPLIIKYPGMPETGLRIGTDAKLIDVMPTIFNILNLSVDENIEEQMQGRSLVPVIENRETTAERDVFSESNILGSFKKSITSGKWKLIHDMKTGNSELYNLEEDPGEQHNVIDKYPEIAGDLKKRLFSFIMGKGNNS
jgi:arylsulfatase A-like enzyme